MRGYLNEQNLPKWAFKILNKETVAKLASDKVKPPVKVSQMRFPMFFIFWVNHGKNFVDGTYRTLWPPTGVLSRGSDPTQPPKKRSQIFIFVTLTAPIIYGGYSSEQNTPPKWTFTILNKVTGLKLASDKVIPPVKACQMRFFMFLIGWGSHRKNYGGGNYGAF